MQTFPNKRGRPHVVQKLQVAGCVLYEAHEEWKAWIADARRTVSEVPQVTPTTPASEGLTTIMTFLLYTNVRAQKLEQSGTKLPPLDLVELLMLGARSTLSTETKMHRLRRTLTHAYDYLKGIHVLLDRRERNLLAAMESVQDILSHQAEFEMAEETQQLFRVESDLEGIDPESLTVEGQGQVEFLCLWARNMLAKQDKLRFEMLYIMSKIGMKLPRQTILTEYFTKE